MTAAMLLLAIALLVATPLLVLAVDEWHERRRWPLRWREYQKRGRP